VISVDPDSFYVELPDQLTTQRILTVSNSGESALQYSVTEVAIPTSTGIVQARRESSEKRTTPSQQTLNLFDTKAIQNSIAKHAGMDIYSTGFEEFATGDINGQNNWVGQYSNWTIESYNPASGSQHFSGLADGLGQSLAFSPLVLPGSDDVSTVSMKLDLDPGVTWQIIPQSPTAGSVNTRFQIAPDGSLSALVQDSVGNVYYQPIAGTLPDGYFDFRIENKASTHQFTVYVNGSPIFTGGGFADEIEQVVIFSLMEDAGQLLDIDNFYILDGPAQAPWLTVDPKSGSAASGSSSIVNLYFDATDVEPGTYSKILNISSNDPATPNVSVPVTLVVLPNLPPVLATAYDKAVRELGTLNLSFTATDADDSVVVVRLENAPDFITMTNMQNGLVSYSAKPLIGDAGDYEITVVAEDGRGGIATENFNLKVTPYGVQNFSLINFQTGAVLQNFEDTVTIDIADPLISKYTIRANTNPGTVGSVKFTLDGSNTNTDNSRYYTINAWLIPVLSGGDHSITAQGFTRSNGNGDGGQVKMGVIRVINSVAVTDFDVVSGSGTKLLDLEDGGVIDISQSGFNKINIVANTGSSTIRSVKFTLNGTIARIDNGSPFALKGNADGSDTFWPASPGSYTLTATPYLSYHAWGPAGTPLTIHFQVINGEDPTVANARSGSASSENEREEMQVQEFGEYSWTIYPVPVIDDLHIKLEGKVEGNVSVNIINTQGQSVHLKDGTAETFRDYTVSTVKLGLTTGFYLIQIQQADGKRITKKFMKE
nr:T9SS type A sorting domain-containing protein [Chryseolinea sp.]